MPNKTTVLPSSDRIVKLLRREHAKNSIGILYKMRLAIILDGVNGMSNYKSHKGLGIGESTGLKWRKRWKENYEILHKMESPGDNNAEQSVKDYEMIKQIKAILSDNYRSGSPRQITLAQREQIVALATEKPEDHNIPMTVWTHEMLAFVAKAEGIVESISSRHIGTILKKKN